MFLPLGLLLEYCIELVSTECIGMKFVFSTKMLYMPWIGAFQASQLMVLVVFNALDYHLTSGLLVYILEIYFKLSIGL